MRHLIYYDADGSITRATGLLDGMEPQPEPGERFLLADVYRSFDNHYVAGGVLRERPPQPSQSHQWDWPTKTWVRDDALAAQQARQQRDALLAACDWTQLPDAPLTTRAAWAEYRQALRDVPTQPGFPEEILWPSPPA